VRVIGGRLKGRRLDGPRWAGLRPTSDSLRETLFNILGQHVAGARVLDGCAGTGAIGIEALSRGASHVTFVDNDRRATALIGRNLARCGVTDGYTIVTARLDGGADGGTGPMSGPFDVVLLDPPYGEDKASAALLDILGERLAPGGVLVLEHAARVRPPDRAGRLTLARQVKAGDSALAFYRLDSP
jgi:16S rRNA (guanine(966)-N(2))-methyltransferase RsmD